MLYHESRSHTWDVLVYAESNALVTSQKEKKLCAD